jgi:AraC-like DNA-binding protein
VTTPAPVNAFAPMVELIENELQAEGIPSPPGARARTSKGFYQWYLEALQLLESHAAGAEANPPMDRQAVEIMCRTALTAGSLAEAMQLIVNFSKIHSGAGNLSLRQTGERCRFTLDARRRQRTTLASLVDVSGLFAFKQLFQWLTGGRAVASRVGIGAISRADLLPFIRLFDAPVLAEGDVTYLEYETSQLDLPVVARKGEFAEFFAYFPCAVFETANASPARQTAALISAAVQQSQAVPNQPQVAAGLGYPLSTFRRRLTEEGTRFRDIRDRCLREAAEDLLQRRISVAQTALQLGFQDSDSFRKAFRRWTGKTPSAWCQTTGRAAGH